MRVLWLIVAVFLSACGSPPQLNDGGLNCEPLSCRLAPNTQNDLQVGQITPYDTKLLCTGVAICNSFKKFEHLCFCGIECQNSTKGNCFCFLNPGGLAIVGCNFCRISRYERTIKLAEEYYKIYSLLGFDAGCSI